MEDEFKGDLDGKKMVKERPLYVTRAVTVRQCVDLNGKLESCAA